MLSVMFNVGALAIFAIAYFKAGEMEPPESRCHIYWPIISIAVFMLSWAFLTTNLFFLIFNQFVLAVLIAIFRPGPAKPPA